MYGVLFRVIKSHFKNFCLNHKVLLLSNPTTSSHVLQPGVDGNQGIRQSLPIDR